MAAVVEGAGRGCFDVSVEAAATLRGAAWLCWVVQKESWQVAMVKRPGGKEWRKRGDGRGGEEMAYDGAAGKRKTDGGCCGLW